MPYTVTDFPRNEMIALVANECGTTMTAAGAALDSLFGSIADIVAHGGRVRISELGIIERRDRKGGQGRNPRTGEPVEIAPSYRAHLSQTKAMKARLAQAAQSPAQAAE